MSLFTITNEYNEPLEAAHARIDDDRYDSEECAAAGQPALDLSNQLQTVASLLHQQSFCAVQMSLFTIATEYNEQLEAAHARNDDDRYDLVECAAAGQPALDLSNQLRDCSIATAQAILLYSANELVYYRHRV